MLASPRVDGNIRLSGQGDHTELQIQRQVIRKPSLAGDLALFDGQHGHIPEGNRFVVFGIGTCNGQTNHHFITGFRRSI